MRNDEFETIIIWNPMRRMWEAGTNIPQHQAMFEKKGWKKTGDTGYDMGYEAPKNALTFRDLTKPKRQMSEEEKAKARERMRKIAGSKTA